MNEHTKCAATLLRAHLTEVGPDVGSDLLGPFESLATHKPPLHAFDVIDLEVRHRGLGVTWTPLGEVAQGMGRQFT